MSITIKTGQSQPSDLNLQKSCLESSRCVYFPVSLFSLLFSSDFSGASARLCASEAIIDWTICGASKSVCVHLNSQHMASVLWPNKNELCSAFVTLVVTNEAGVLRAAPSLVIVAGAQVQHDKWSSGEGFCLFPCSLSWYSRHRHPPHQSIHLQRCLRIVKRIQTSAQRLGVSMRLGSAQSVSFWNDTFKGCGAQTVLSVWLIIAESWGKGGGAQYCWKCCRNQKYLKKQKWVLLRTLSKALLFDFCWWLLSITKLLAGPLCCPRLCISVPFKSTNIYKTIDPLFYKPKPFSSFCVIVVRQLDRISNIFSFKRTILILLSDWRMEVLAFLFWGPLPGSVIGEDQGQFVKRRPVMLCWTAEELWQSESSPENIGC